MKTEIPAGVREIKWWHLELSEQGHYECTDWSFYCDEQDEDWPEEITVVAKSNLDQAHARIKELERDLEEKTERSSKEFFELRCIIAGKDFEIIKLRKENQRLHDKYDLQLLVKRSEELERENERLKMIEKCLQVISDSVEKNLSICIYKNEGSHRAIKSALKGDNDE